LKRLLPLFLLLVGLACGQGDTLRLGWNASFRLQPPGPAFFANQLVTVTLPDGSEQQLLCTVESGPEALTVVASTTLGQTLFTASLKGGRCMVEKHLPLPSQADPRMLLALVQLAHWPLEPLRQGLQGDLELREDGLTRTLLKGGKPFLRLNREGRSQTLELPDYQIRARISDLEEAP